MRKMMSLVTIASVATLIFTGCVAEKTTTQGGTLAPPTANFLSSTELKELLNGHTIAWKNFKSGKSGKVLFNTDGTTGSINTWIVTQDGFKCNVFRKKEYCAKFIKKGNKYVGIDKNGDAIFEMIAKNINNNEEVVIKPANGESLSSEEVKMLFSDVNAEWSYLNKNKKGKTTYHANGTLVAPGGTWRITPDGFKCQTYNNKEYCGKVYQENSKFYLTNPKGDKAVGSFTIQQ